MTKTKFKVGDRVFRKGFGNGKIVKIESDKYSHSGKNAHVLWDDRKNIDTMNHVENLKLLEDEGEEEIISARNEDFDELNLSSQIVDRKDYPVFSGVLKYFPLAIMEVAKISKMGNDKHNPGEPLHWDRTKSTDELDALSRHLIDVAMGEDNPAKKFDSDGARHMARVCWRALAYLEKELENEQGKI
jgi:hypothetical protein